MFKSIYSQFGSYKGLNGKIGTIGGCLQYTGAPYYASITALKAGGDLSHVFCTQSAGIPIKSYTPQLIVHPTLKSQNQHPTENLTQQLAELTDSVTRWFPALTSLIVGPGLGRDPFLTQTLIPNILLTPNDLITIVDADGLNLLTKQKIPLRKAILTPNRIEFLRLYRHYIGEINYEPVFREAQYEQLGIEEPGVLPVVELSNVLESVVFLKGHSDVITDGQRVFCVSAEGSRKRCGGIGDILSGCLGAILHLGAKNNVSLLESAVAASLLTRKASKRAFEQKEWSLTAPDIINWIPYSLKDFLNQQV